MGAGPKMEDVMMSHWIIKPTLGWSNVVSVEEEHQLMVTWCLISDIATMTDL